MFDPALQTGVAVLWNGSSRKPWAIEWEVMDMVYGLEPRDWLDLDASAPKPAPLPLAEAAQPLSNQMLSDQALANETRAQTGK